ncbi:hypothetical protein B0H63DRAFT_65634 [Podospora didyma]|uniref:Kinesin light chain n=1 Tax=Podospora didyma TaxID=330526 RepID=A0AAE0P8L9_9PEZI|nr:hypothetical protein B0H63DRAFT_65634 [Podospora didyma]
MYSLVLVCFWLLFREDLLSYWAHQVSVHGDTVYPDLTRPDEKAICNLKVQDGVLAFAERHLAQRSSSSAKGQLNHLMTFWRLSLARSVEDRPSTLWDLRSFVWNLDDSNEHVSNMIPDSDLQRITRLGYGDQWKGEPRETFELTTKARVSYQSPFLMCQTSKYLYQPTQVDYRLRKQLVHCLEVRSDSLDDRYQLALCKRMGFGTRLDRTGADGLAQTSSRSMFDLEQDICRIRQERLEPEFQETFQGFFEAGQMAALTNVVEAHSPVGIRSLKTAYDTEIRDLKITLGSSSEIVLLLQQRVAGILTHLGHLDQAADLLSDVQKGIAERQDEMPAWPPIGQHCSSRFIERQSREHAKMKAARQNAASLLKSQANLAAAHRKRGQWEKARELELEVLAQLRALRGEAHLDTAQAMENLATTCMKQRRWREAERLALGVLKTRERELGSDHRLTLRSEGMLAAIYGCVSTCREDDEGSADELHPSTDTKVAFSPSLQKKIAAEERRQKRWGKAESLLDRVLHHSRMSLGSHDLEVVDTKGSLAAVYCRQRRWADAQRLEYEVYRARDAALGTATLTLWPARAIWHSFVRERGPSF